MTIEQLHALRLVQRAKVEQRYTVGRKIPYFIAAGIWQELDQASLTWLHDNGYIKLWFITDTGTRVGLTDKGTQALRDDARH